MAAKAIKLGDEVEDVITGFSGIAVAKTDWIHGCSRVTIQPPVDKDGKHPDAISFDEPAVKLVKKEKVKPDIRRNKTGGPKDDAAALRKD